MNSSLVFWLFDLLSRLPLSFLHRLGVMAGWLSYWTSKKYAARLHENLHNACQGRAEIDFQQVLSANIGEVGKTLAELCWVWRRPVHEVAASVKTCHGWDLVTAALAQGKGLIIVTPHLGCFEITAQYISSHIPVTCMYRVPKLVWLDKVMRAGRERGQMKLARADIGGVRTLFKALKRGEAIGLLPDQVPGNGEGEWADFFGRPAYSMTLVNRLVEASGATILMCYAERLPRGRGFDLYFSALTLDQQSSPTQQINRAVEQIIFRVPEQYLWSYNRYKTPRGVLPPPSQQGETAC